MAVAPPASPTGPIPASAFSRDAGAPAPALLLAVDPDPSAAAQLLPAQRVAISGNGTAPTPVARSLTPVPSRPALAAAPAPPAAAPAPPAAGPGQPAATAPRPSPTGTAPRAATAAALATAPAAAAVTATAGPAELDDAATSPELAALAYRPTHSRTLIEWTAVLAGALLVALLIKVFLFQAFMIPSESMTPTLNVGDRVLVNKLSYRLHDIKRGDVVVFRRPPAAKTPTDSSDLIKRVVGLPGEVVEGSGGVVYVNGKPLHESYLPSRAVTTDFAKVTVGPHEIFVMGDNRQNSRDSRFFGPVPEDLVVGRSFVRVWPVGHLKLF